MIFCRLRKRFLCFPECGQFMPDQFSFHDEDSLHGKTDGLVHCKTRRLAYTTRRQKTSLMSLISSFVFLMAIQIIHASDTDPCSETEIKDEPWRDVSNPGKGLADPGCDQNVLVPGIWYSFRNNGQPASIPTSCIKTSMCGTEIGMRVSLSQELPQAGETIEAVLCGAYNVLGKYDCCVLRTEVKIARCDDGSLVYQFPYGFDRCPMAVCTVDDKLDVPTESIAARGQMFPVTTSNKDAEEEIEVQEEEEEDKEGESDSPEEEIEEEPVIMEDEPKIEDDVTPNEAAETDENDEEDDDSTNDKSDDENDEDVPDTDDAVAGGGDEEALITSTTIDPDKEAEEGEAITSSTDPQIEGEPTVNTTSSEDDGGLGPHSLVHESTESTDSETIDSSSDSDNSTQSSGIASFTSTVTSNDTADLSPTTSTNRSAVESTTTGDMETIYFTAGNASNNSLSDASVLADVIDSNFPETDPIDKYESTTAYLSSTSEARETSVTSHSFATSTTESATSSASPEPAGTSSSSQTMTTSRPSTTRDSTTTTTITAITISTPTHTATSSSQRSSQSTTERIQHRDEVKTTETTSSTTSTSSSLPSSSSITSSPPSAPSFPTSSQTPMPSTSTHSRPSDESNLFPDFPIETSDEDVIMFEKVRLVFEGVYDTPVFSNSIERILRSFFLGASRAQKKEDGSDWKFNLMGEWKPVNFDNKTTYVDFTVMHTLQSDIFNVFSRLQLEKYIYKQSNLTLLAECRPSKQCQESALASTAPHLSVLEKNLPILITVLTLCTVCFVVLIVGVICARCWRTGTWYTPAGAALENKTVPPSRPTAGPQQSPFTDAQIMKDENLERISLNDGSARDGDTGNDAFHPSNEQSWVIPMDEAPSTNHEHYGRVSVATQSTRF